MVENVAQILAYIASQVFGSLAVFNFIHPIWFLADEPGSTEIPGATLADESFYDVTSHTRLPFSMVSSHRLDARVASIAQSQSNWEFRKTVEKDESFQRGQTQTAGSSYADSEGLQWATGHVPSIGQPRYEGSMYIRR